ncbi:SDR family oxidoreductase [Actinoplanes sp. LDG1-06]|uniref:SDR family oxidoreductase n=1 Tax=Paractinoplanes ovalisporus TaxID=2810368 RepID=A0ABS2AHL8_9ACTN|nr:SDR family oxidoreductase [Actinoplanes ovalisporus]MBM2619331.1 SDR family oxidoreductase [Actinoplanes ovalisporus]
MTSPTVLVAGASRTIGRAIAEEFLRRGWQVIGTVRDPARRTELHDLADRSDGRLEIEQLDVTRDDHPAALSERLAGRELDVLFVNAGTNSNDQTPIAQVPVADFTKVMVTNALGPMRVIEALAGLVSPAGLIGAMSSGQASITGNTKGSHELYRGSKAALNMFMRGYAARQPEGTSRALVLMAPGWIRTDIGGPDAPFTIDDNIPKVVDVLLAKRERPGLEYLDYEGKTVAW